jgi:hypothetical protein
MLTPANRVQRVRAGDPITVGPWNAAAKLFRRLQLVAGKNCRLRSMPRGTIVSFDAKPEIFRGAFYVTLNGIESCTVSFGYVNKVPATILQGGTRVPVEGDPSKNLPVPTLSLRSLKLMPDNTGYIALEVSCSLLNWDVQFVDMVQVADLTTLDGEYDEEATPQVYAGGTPTITPRMARHPVARIRRLKDGTLQVKQIVYHNLGHRVNVRNKSDPTINNARHFFFPEG